MLALRLNFEKVFFVLMVQIFHYSVLFDENIVFLKSIVYSDSFVKSKNSKVYNKPDKITLRVTFEFNL